MASSTELSFVFDNIESDYLDKGWEEGSAETRLDAGAVPERVVAAYWRMRANASLSLVNTSESGSSRGNDSVYPRLKALADEWDARASAIENPAPVETRGRLGSFPIRRV